MEAIDVPTPLLEGEHSDVSEQVEPIRELFGDGVPSGLKSARPSRPTFQGFPGPHSFTFAGVPYP
jgi:hypothetical protein